MTDEQEQQLTEQEEQLKEENLDEDPFARTDNEEPEIIYSRKWIKNAIYSYNLFDNPA